jgi:hypothetical protein
VKLAGHKYKLNKDAWIVIGGIAAAVSAAVLLFRSPSSAGPSDAGVGASDLMSGGSSADAMFPFDQLTQHLQNIENELAVIQTQTHHEPGGIPAGPPPPPPVVRPPAREIPSDLPPSPKFLLPVPTPGGPITDVTGSLGGAPGEHYNFISERAATVQRDFLTSPDAQKINVGTEIHLVNGEIFRVGYP